MEGFLFGADPELFVLNDKGVPVTAEGLIPGTKEKPFKVKGGAIQVDGMAAEFNIDPVNNFQDFSRNITQVLAALQGHLPAGYTLSAVPSVVLGKKEFEKAPDIAKILGCNPDFNAWSGDLNPPPHDPSNPRLRTASGHLHIGWTDDADTNDAAHLLNCFDLVKQLDWFLGGWSVQQDPDPVRRGLYGKAGACRPKSYGVEYRVLSNFWVTDRDQRLAVWNRMQLAIHEMRTRFAPEKLGDAANAMLIEVINKTTRNESLEKAYAYPLTTTAQSRARY
jgi:hypothetical protein